MSFTVCITIINVIVIIYLVLFLIIIIISWKWKWKRSHLGGFVFLSVPNSFVFNENSSLCCLRCLVVCGLSLVSHSSRTHLSFVSLVSHSFDQNSNIFLYTCFAFLLFHFQQFIKVYNFTFFKDFNLSFSNSI